MSKRGKDINKGTGKDKLKQNKTKSVIKKTNAKKVLMPAIYSGTFVLPSINNKKSVKKKNFFLILSGMAIGFLNGFFGGGGGMVCVPILQKVLKLDAKESHATAILVIFPLSLISSFIYVINGHVESLSLLTVGLGVVLGGIFGAMALKFLPSKAIRIIFAIIMFVGGVKLII